MEERTKRWAVTYVIIAEEMAHMKNRAARMKNRATRMKNRAAHMKNRAAHMKNRAVAQMWYKKKSLFGDTLVNIWSKGKLP